MRIGFHFPFSGGLIKLKDRIRVARGNIFQIFARGLRGGELKELHPKRLEVLLDYVEEKRVIPIIHAPYVYNIANLESMDEEKILEDLEYAKLFRSPYYVIHPGRSRDIHPLEALENTKYQLWDILNRSDYHGEILVKNTRGAGTEIGFDLREWKELISFHPQVKGALDLARLSTAGYDFRSEDAAYDLYFAIEEYIGWEKVKLIYVNDTHSIMGSRKEDRSPPPLGEGTIGFQGYKHFLNIPEVKKKMWMVENSPDESYYMRSLDYLLPFFDEE